ncbi:MAG: VWA domain-containing protein [Acidobacteriaceae bacterium]|nr:VWA domain-containing protein [Acidobacteriaceae bacterium]
MKSARSITLLLTVLLLGLPKLHGQNSAERRRSDTFRANTTLVLVPVTVTDHRHSLVTGLRSEAFRVFEDRIPKKNYSLSEEDVPASIGIVFDTSGSMKGPLTQAKDALQAFVNTANPQDEAFLYTVSDRPGRDSKFTSDLTSLVTDLSFVGAKGNTALVDTIYSGLSQMRSARNSRKALLVISDGMDNHSRYTRHELMTEVLESDVQIFCISVYDPPAYAKPFDLREQQQGQQLLDDLSDATGGLHLVVRDSEDISRSVETIGRALRDEYLISYLSARSDSGKWHSIEVKLRQPGLKVHARSGYRSE